MPDSLFWLVGVAIMLAIAGVAFFVSKKRGPRIPDALRPGRSLPDFPAADEQGNPIRSVQVVGSPTVMLFVRGNWCPFCTKQVEGLTRHYQALQGHRRSWRQAHLRHAKAARNDPPRRRVLRGRVRLLAG